MKIPFLLMIGVAFCLSGCGDQKSGGGSETNTASGNPLTAPVDYLGAVGKAQQHAIKTVDVASITQAVQMFHAEHQRYPKDLNELVNEKFLGKIPDAPYGMKIDYDATTGQVKVVKQ
jgi:hypothetical protein